MCRPATCKSCGKATYAGCGNHVEQVLGHVPMSQRCACGPTEKVGFFGRLFGR
jgi:hypothetical protein